MTDHERNTGCHPGDATPRPQRFKGLGAISAHMTIIANYPIHVNGAYRDKRHPRVEFMAD